MANVETNTLKSRPINIDKDTCTSNHCVIIL